MYKLPTTVYVFDREYKIRDDGDFRLVLDVVTACQDVDLTQEEQTVTALILFYDGLESREDVLLEFDTQELLQEAIKQMMDFISCGDKGVGHKVNYKLIDWKSDETLIVSAINPMLGDGNDIRRMEYMHWWTFISYYMGIGESVLSTVVGIRNKIIKGKKLDDYEKTFKRDNPEYFNWKNNNKTQDEINLENDIMNLWKSD